MDCNFLTVRSMADHMPYDLLTEILVRLPVVSLLLFKSVCKRWYSLITSPSLVTKHLNQSFTKSETNGDKLLVRLYDGKSDKKERYLLLNDDEKFGDKYSELESPFKLPFRYCRVVGCCNGASESFSEIMLPPTLAYQNVKSLSIHVFGESLAVSCTGESDGGACSIWLMKEYGVAESWTTLFSSKLLGMPNRTLGFRKNGEVLLALDNSLASCAPWNHNIGKHWNYRDCKHILC